MNILFFGSSGFSLYFLEEMLLKRKDNLVVVTALDKPKGRGLKIYINPIKEFCLKNNIKVYQFDDVNDPQIKALLARYDIDLGVVVSYGRILSSEVLRIPKIFFINVHPSLLPKYRGAAPINWALINGEKKTGISIIKMTETMDAGPIILQKEIDIDLYDDVLSLEKKLASIGKIMLIEAVKMIENNNFSFIPQNDDEATFAPKLRKEDGLIDWNRSAFSIFNLIRGCYGWPSAFTYYRNKLLKIHKAEFLSVDQKIYGYLPGQIVEVSSGGIVVACGCDSLIIKELQLEGRRRMTVEEFICGHRFDKGERFG